MTNDVQDNEDIKSKTLFIEYKTQHIMIYAKI